MVHFLRVFQRARNASLDEILQKEAFVKFYVTLKQKLL